MLVAIQAGTRRGEQAGNGGGADSAHSGSWKTTRDMD